MKRLTVCFLLMLCLTIKSFAQVTWTLTYTQETYVNSTTATFCKVVSNENPPHVWYYQLTPTEVTQLGNAITAMTLDTNMRAAAAASLVSPNAVVSTVVKRSN